MSFYEYWIGQNIGLNAVWRDYEEGAGYERKFRQTKCHLLEIEFETPPTLDPLFSFEAVFKTTKRYFHDMKQACLSPREYDEAAPLYFYGVARGSAIWQWLGELRQTTRFTLCCPEQSGLNVRLSAQPNVEECSQSCRLRPRSGSR